MSKNHAIIVEKQGEAVKAEVPIPKLRDDYMLVKVKAVALNPTDWKHVDYVAPPGARIGCDYSGIVEEVGSKVTKNFKKGDRVTGFVHGGNSVYLEDGSFGEYITAKGDVQIKIPDNLSFEEASTLGIGITTVGQALYQSLELPLPNKPTNANPKIAILIYGGSSATGSLAIQFAKLSGLQVITTCSPHNFDYVKSLGADAVFDYKSPTCSQDIRALTNDNLTYAFDTISEGDSPKITLNSLSSTHPSLYTTLLPVAKDLVQKLNPKATMKHTLGYTVVGEFFAFGPSKWEARPEDFEFGKMFWELSRDLLAEGKIKVHKPEVDRFGKGFEGILKGMDEMRQGRVSGVKLVYRL